MEAFLQFFGGLFIVCLFAAGVLGLVASIFNEIALDKLKERLDKLEEERDADE